MFVESDNVLQMIWLNDQTYTECKYGSRFISLFCVVNYSQITDLVSMC